MPSAFPLDNGASVHHLTHHHLVLLPRLLPPRIRTRIRAAAQPLIRLPCLVRVARKTPLRNSDVLADILDQRLLAHVVVLWADKPENHKTQGCAVEIPIEAMQNMDLNAARSVLVVRVVADGENSRVHCFGGGRRGRVVEVGDGVA